MTYDGPILDNHFHLNRNGRFLDAAMDFQRAGGTDLVLVHCPDFAKPPETLAGHRAAYQGTIDMAAKVRGEVGLGVRVVLGPHPAAFAHQFERWVAEDVVSGEEKAINNYLVKLVRHYAPANVDASSTHGLTPSVLIGKGALEELMNTYEASSHGFFLETDYMDDLRRPGAVLGPKTVPKRTQQLIAAGLPEDILWNTHQELAQRVYGV